MKPKKYEKKLLKQLDKSLKRWEKLFTLYGAYESVASEKRQKKFSDKIEKKYGDKMDFLCDLLDALDK